MATDARPAHTTVTTPSVGRDAGTRRVLPMFQGLLPVDRARVPAEIVAGVTLAALGIPEVMGYTKIAGTPVVTGLYTLLLPVTVFAIFGSSRHLVVGADSATAAMLAAGLVGLAATGSSQYVALCGMVALIAGAFLILARLARLGFLADFLSRTVLIGFLTGVGFQVAAGQLSAMMGISKGPSGAFRQIGHAVAEAGNTSLSTLAVALSVILVIVGTRMIDRKIPGALIAVIGVIFVSWAANLSAHGVAVLGTVPGGLPSLGWPGVPWSETAKLVTTAGSIFVVILAQSAATSRAYATKYDEPLDEDVDLVGLGLASAAAGFSGTFVVNGSPTKTQMVDTAGGRSQLAQLTTAVIVLVVLLFLTAPLQYLPSAVLAAVVFLIGIELIDLPGMHKIYVVRLSEFVVAAITALVVIVVGVEQGILVAILLSLFDHVRHSYHPRDALLTTSGSGRLKAVPLETHAQIAPGLVVYRFGASLYYANTNRFSEEVTKAVSKGATWIGIEAGSVGDVDYSGAETLRDLHAQLENRGVRLAFANVHSDVRAELDRYGITALVGEDAYFETVSELADAFAADLAQRAQ